jgi:hypothetical protein
MMRYKGLLFALAAVPAMFAAAPAAAQMATSEAEQLRQLDIMLMVTALRCRSDADDFQADYNRFSARHLATMNQAAQQLRANYGTGQQAVRRLDRISTTIANRFGQGHPWLECGQLRAVTRDLADSSGRQVLLAAAEELLADGAPRRDTLVARYGE